MKALFLLILGAATSSLSLGLALNGFTETCAFVVLFCGAALMVLSLFIMARS